MLEFHERKYIKAFNPSWNDPYQRDEEWCRRCHKYHEMLDINCEEEEICLKDTEKKGYFYFMFKNNRKKVRYNDDEWKAICVNLAAKKEIDFMGFTQMLDIDSDYAWGAPRYSI